MFFHIRSVQSKVRRLAMVLLGGHRVVYTSYHSCRFMCGIVLRGPDTIRAPSRAQSGGPGERGPEIASHSLPLLEEAGESGRLRATSDQHQ